MIGIDLGSNTLRICEFAGGRRVRADELIVGSARGLVPGGRLSEGAKARILAGLAEFDRKYGLKRRILDGAARATFAGGLVQSADVRAVATEAFRLACDSGEFFAQVEREFGVRFNIIDALTEARLTRLGIDARLRELGLTEAGMLYIDMGGASTEISGPARDANGDKSELSRSFPFGIVRFCNEFDVTDAANLTANAAKFVSSGVRFARDIAVRRVVLTSGVPTTVAAMLRGLDYASYDADAINGARVRLDDFASAGARVAAMSADEAARLVGPDRQDLIVAGCAMFAALLGEICAAKPGLPLIVIDDGLREGVAMAGD